VEGGQPLLELDVRCERPADEADCLRAGTVAPHGLLLRGLELRVQRQPQVAVRIQAQKGAIGFAREFAQAVLAENPGQLLSYNCSPSFNWKANLSESQIASFQDELSALGYKYQFITLAGIHVNWYNTFQFAHAYARGEGMKHYTEMVQEPEFAARDKGYTFVSHQQEVGAGYFDDVTTVIQGGASSVTALTGSTEEAQFG